MFKDYSNYKTTDFLIDDYFVDSMLEPTAKSENFWKVLIEENKIDVDEFLSAYMTLKDLHENKPDVSDEQIDMLWERISKTNEEKSFRLKSVQFLRYAAIACVMVGVIGFSLFTYLKSNKLDQSIVEFAQNNTIHTQQPSSQIQLVSGTKTLAVEGTQAQVEYSANGQLIVNKKSIAVAESNTPLDNKAQFNQLRVPYGKRAFLKLSDGTLLWVNTGSTVIYPATFSKNKREIYVDGEVYAEVFHDKNDPLSSKQINWMFRYLEQFLMSLLIKKINKSMLF